MGSLVNPLQSPGRQKLKDFHCFVSRIMWLCLYIEFSIFLLNILQHLKSLIVNKPFTCCWKLKTWIKWTSPNSCSAWEQPGTVGWAGLRRGAEHTTPPVITQPEEHCYVYWVKVCSNNLTQSCLLPWASAMLFSRCALMWTVSQVTILVPKWYINPSTMWCPDLASKGPHCYLVERALVQDLYVL